MMLSFAGRDKPLIVEPGYPAVFQVESPGLFAQVVESLFSGDGRCATEQYALWERNGDEWEELPPKDAFLLVPNVFDLPWSDRALAGEIIRRMEADFVADEEFRLRFEKSERDLSAQIMALSNPYSADYSLGVEWDLGKLLKLLGFGIGAEPGAKLIDNLISFLSLALDSRLEKAIVFVNLKTFLTENEVKRLYEHCFFSKRKVILLENKRDGTTYQYERKTVIDLDFLEY